VPLHAGWALGSVQDVGAHTGIRRCIPTSVFNSLVAALVLSRLDYCNNLLIDLPLSHPVPPVSPKCRSKAHFQPETLRPHYRCAPQSSLAPRAGTNYIQGGDAGVSRTAWLRTTLLGVVIHTRRRHAAPTQAQVRLH